jgi:hypothetical protein
MATWRRENILLPPAAGLHEGLFPLQDVGDSKITRTTVLRNA